MTNTGVILPIKKAHWEGLFLLGCAATISLMHAESEGLVKAPPATNSIFQSLLPSGPASDQLAAADAFADSGDTEKAITTYRFVAKSYPKSAEAPKAQFKLAKQLDKKGQFEAAFKEYQTLLQKYPQTPNFEEAVADQITIANAFLKGLKVKFLGIPMVPSMEKAEEMYAAILKAAPYSKHLSLIHISEPTRPY